ncbi:MAG: hypothetical protein LBR74_08215 [Eubacterium sp.]|nr:hypothetical protein [Eubacterium sp.]
MVKRDRLSFKISFSAVTVAISVVLMFGSMIPGFNYISPALAGILIFIIYDEIGMKWAMLSFLTCSFAVLFVVPGWESAMLFVLFFGYYPTLRKHAERVKIKVFRGFLKFLCFNIAIFLIYLVLNKLLKINDMLEGLEVFGETAVFVLWATSNFTFLIYDMSLDNITFWYKKTLKPRLTVCYANLK